MASGPRKKQREVI